MLRKFLADDSGAVTVDWVVLTGGVVGLGLATMGVVSGGIENLSGDIEDQLTGTGISASFSTLGDLLSTDFSNGSVGWNGGTVVDLAGFGEVLQLGPGVMTLAQVDVPPGADTATVTFDLLGVDDLSGEPATIFVNGQAVAIYSDNHGRITTSEPGVPGVQVGIDQHYTNDPVGSGSHGHDSRATYTITVDDPGETLSFGVGSGTGQPITEEFYAIDDVTISAS